MAVARASRQDRFLYSNAPDAIYWHTGRVTMWLPEHFDRNTTRPRPDYATRMGRMVEDVRSDRAVILLFRAIRRPYQPTAADIVGRLSDVPRRELPDAIVIGVSP